jgi:hypothetical protein
MWGRVPDDLPRLAPMLPGDGLVDILVDILNVSALAPF